MEDKLNYWKQVTEQWRQSGQTQKEFCKEREIKLTTLTYWMGRIKKEEKEASQVKDLVCMSMPALSESAANFVLEIEQQYRLTIPVGFNTDTLKKILGVIVCSSIYHR